MKIKTGFELRDVCGDKVIIATYAMIDENQAAEHEPIVVLVDDQNVEIAPLP